MRHLYTFVLFAFLSAAAHGQRHSNLESYSQCPPYCGGQSNEAARQQLERERARLLQEERQLQEQLQRDQAANRRMQQDQARRQQQRDQNARQWQQLGDMYQREMGRIEMQQQQEEAAARERETQRQLQALRKQLQEMQNQPALATPSEPSAPGSAPESQQQTQEPNPFEKDAKQASGIKDPEADHAGEACTFFTKPMVREDGAGLNVYAEGTAVCYGKRMYQCKNRRWANVGRCDMYADWERHKAERLEGSSLKP